MPRYLPSSSSGIRNAHWWWSATFVGLRWQEAPAAARLLKPHTGLQTHYHPHHPHHPHHTSWCTMYTHKQINILTRKLIDLVKRIKQVTKYHNASLDSRGLIFRGYCHPAYHWMFKSDVTRGCISGMRKLPSSNGASLASGRGSVSPSGGRQTGREAGFLGKWTTFRNFTTFCQSKYNRASKWWNNLAWYRDIHYSKCIM